MNNPMMTLKVGDAVDVRPYSLAPGDTSWEAGWTVVALEWEDYTVARGGIRTVLGCNRVRAAVAS